MKVDSKFRAIEMEEKHPKRLKVRVRLTVILRRVVSIKNVSEKNKMFDKILLKFWKITYSFKKSLVIFSRKNIL